MIVGLSGLLERLEKAIADLEAQNEGGEDAPVAHLPKELADKDLRDRVRQAMADLGSQKRHKRINLTDPSDEGQAGHLAGYNAQAMRLTHGARMDKRPAWSVTATGRG